MTTVPARHASSSEFDIEIDVDARVVRLVGELDATTAPLLLAVAKTFLAEFPGDLTLDLGGVVFADSALLNAMIEIRNDSALTRGDLWLVNHSAAIKRLFLAAGATDWLTTNPDT